MPRGSSESSSEDLAQRRPAARGRRLSRESPELVVDVRDVDDRLLGLDEFVIVFATWTACVSEGMGCMLFSRPCSFL